jgi:hypothetical protein
MDHGEDDEFVSALIQAIDDEVGKLDEFAGASAASRPSELSESSRGDTFNMRVDTRDDSPSRRRIRRRNMVVDGSNLLGSSGPDNDLHLLRS